MDSAGMRHHEPQKCQTLDDPTQPPKYTVNLSLPPEERYRHIATGFKDRLEGLSQLFDDILLSFLPRPIAKLTRLLAQIMLRRVYSTEETAELRGISQSTGIGMWLLVAFNVLLDLLMGCTSGGVRVKDPRSDKGHKLVHFRTLDWGMDPLRRIVIELEFVEETGGAVVARSMTYFGYVGVLTGVRRGLSLSLNFRPHHDTSSWCKRFSYACHLILVLLGLRLSISSHLRAILLPPRHRGENPQGREESETARDQRILDEFTTAHSTAAYLVFCTGTETITMEKDNGTALVRRAEDFIVVMNHDEQDEQEPSRAEESVHREQVEMEVTGLADLVGFSVERKQRAVKLWNADTRSPKKQRARRQVGSISGPMVRLEDVIRWMDPDVSDISNEETHYGVIMEPSTGKFIWRQRWLEPKENSDME
ncbi:beta subunit of N-acylethanolamine-hydrolyzing acid amidase-domain-containing protein [Pseudomassariella vexata]|uniref:ceramidase n=1 Tax=Pseudomassariella vexata TaxID=1141098 RepID=A0A1Y2E6N0_9PEZI|nr:beta subunit of N-acylethanolamine-hydrolyzing acid amidase-domain-containing protein [Pseudomassariella vexata]ORY67169.1 beta subunit of N-acylethanolamine-hydrolyzing acid amidase-domain-containing protein [Pseudomassariella vexata]